MKVNYKQLYLALKQEEKVLKSKLFPEEYQLGKVNSVPENFNQIGYDLTIEKVEIMLEKMKQLKEVKGNRLTPPFYRSIYNRALIASNEIDKLMETITIGEDDTIDYEAEFVKLNAEIHSLNLQLAEKESQEQSEEIEEE